MRSYGRRRGIAHSLFSHNFLFCFTIKLKGRAAENDDKNMGFT
ncbi:hypothetical protein HMPREF3215_01342 [Staphylococcus simulans]|nr:hypothetical protein HMPREF3215_01342 [Staphylococcus simulans]